MHITVSSIFNASDLYLIRKKQNTRGTLYFKDLYFFNQNGHMVKYFAFKCGQYKVG